MEATELRFGNLIDKYGKAIKVDWGILQKLENGSVIYKPIPLTEEWLLKWGFVNTKSGYEFIMHSKRARLSVILRPDGIGMVGISGPFGLYDSIHYKYVHQLQNLYFALVGEELQLK